MDAFLYNTAPLWNIGDSSMIKVKDCYLEIEFRSALEGRYDTKPDSKLPALQQQYTRLLRDGKILDIPVLSLLAQPALYNWLMLAVAAILMYRKKYDYIILPLLPLCYSATLLLGPCILPRYCLHAMLCAPVLLGMCVHLHNNEHEQEKLNKVRETQKTADFSAVFLFNILDQTYFKLSSGI